MDFLYIPTINDCLRLRVHCCATAETAGWSGRPRLPHGVSGQPVVRWSSKGDVDLKARVQCFSLYWMAHVETVQINSVCFESLSACDPPVNWWLFSLSLTLNRAPCWAAMSSWAACWRSPWPLRPMTIVQGQTPQTPATTQLLTFRRLCEQQWRMCFQCTISSFWSVTKSAVTASGRTLRFVFAVLLPIILASSFEQYLYFKYLFGLSHSLLVNSLCDSCIQQLPFCVV